MDDKASVYIIDALSKIGENFHFKDKQPLLMKLGIIYKFTCSCGSTYIGQTRHNLLKHLLQNPTHHMEFNAPTILGSENDTARQLILESLFIQEQTPDLNNDSQSSPQMIFNT